MLPNEGTGSINVLSEPELFETLSQSMYLRIFSYFDDQNVDF